MGKLTEEEVKHIAQLANLPLSEDEEEQFQKQLADTIEYIGRLREIGTANVVPTAQVTGKENELREDEINPPLSQSESLKNAPQSYKGYFVTKFVWD